MKLLFVAPLPPPTSGHSLAAEILYKSLKNDCTIHLVNTSFDTLKSGNLSILKVKNTLSILRLVWQYRRNSDYLYITISESILGNLKDLLCYLILYRKLDQMVIHLHGGSFKKHILDKSLILKNLNRFFISKFKEVIVLGKSHRNIFKGLIDEKRVKVIPNFALSNLFIGSEELENKFIQLKKIKLIFFSNLIEGKGYKLLLEAFTRLSPEIKVKYTLDFAGSFDSDKEKADFLGKISQEADINYHGLLHGKSKEKFLKEAHIFCLPTELFEGQPISILEAYASGCLVLTTNKPGILDIFKHKTNGYLIDEKNVESILTYLIFLSDNLEDLKRIAKTNSQIAKEKYSLNKHCDSVKKVLFA